MIWTSVESSELQGIRTALARELRELTRQTVPRRDQALSDDDARMLENV